LCDAAADVGARGLLGRLLGFLLGLLAEAGERESQDG
jgi:hypothetical protein